MFHLQIINMAIQLNRLQVGYVSTCRLLYGSGLIDWWTIIPLPTIAIQLNTLQVGYVSTCRLIVWFRFNGLVDNHPTNLL